MDTSSDSKSSEAKAEPVKKKDIPRQALAPNLAYYPAQAVPNAGVFRILNEDHTLGNVLSTKLLEDERVKFAGYTVPHPFNRQVVLRVQTTDKTDPVTVLRDASTLVAKDILALQAAWQQAVNRHVGVEQ